MTPIRYERDDAGVVTLTLDAPGQSVNTMDAAFQAAFRDTVARLDAEKDDITGILLTSAKSTFFAGADLKQLVQIGPEQAGPFFDAVSELTTGLRRLETLGVPVVAAINGSALGGGFELCLACHRRIVLDDERVRVGQPEVSLGVMPGGGAVVRLVRMLGIERALPLLVEGRRLRPADALREGIVDELAPDRETLLASARDWIRANPNPVQPWDRDGYRMPGGTPASPKLAQKLAVAPGLLQQKTHGCYPAPEAILSAAVEGALLDFDSAQRIETRYFVHLVTSQIAKNMIGTLWFQLNDVKAGASRPDGFDVVEHERVGVLGAGMMGSGIAHACATSGIETVLKDISVEAAERGKGYSAMLLDKKVSRGRATPAARDAALARITATDDPRALTGCDLIIEAVFEDRALKARVTEEAEPLLAEAGVFASNTSTLPITGLAQASASPDRFIGLHFFSPVDKMQLVEIIVGERTADETLARAFDFVRQIGKIPIVVNDSRGFYTSRVFGAYVNEGVAMLGEGVPAPSIESAALQAGMPTGPLAVTDEVSLSLAKHIRDQTRKDLEAAGKTYVAHPAESVLDRMVDEFERRGKAAGAGFYEYPEHGKKFLWPGLREHFQQPEAGIPFADMQERLLFIQALETVRCMDEGVLRSVKDANIGSIFGFGFAPWAGGSIQYVNQYGLASFVARADALAGLYGERFAPPASLRERAAAGEPLA